jgi:hypothetical protein
MTRDPIEQGVEVVKIKLLDVLESCQKVCLMPRKNALRQRSPKVSPVKPVLRP